MQIFGTSTIKHNITMVANYAIDKIKQTVDTANRKWLLDMLLNEDCTDHEFIKAFELIMLNRTRMQQLQLTDQVMQQIVNRFMKIRQYQYVLRASMQTEHTFASSKFVQSTIFNNIIYTGFYVETNHRQYVVMLFDIGSCEFHMTETSICPSMFTISTILEILNWCARKNQPIIDTQYYLHDIRIAQ